MRHGSELAGILELFQGGIGGRLGIGKPSRLHLTRGFSTFEPFADFGQQGVIIASLDRLEPVVNALPFTRLLRRPFEGPQSRTDFRQQVGNAISVVFCFVEIAIRFGRFHLQTGQVGGVFEESAAFFGSLAQCSIHQSLPDHRIRLPERGGKVMHVFQANFAAVDEELVFPRAHGAAGDGDFGKLDGKPPSAVVEGNSDFGESTGRPATAASEDDIFGFLAAQQGMALLAEHPAYAVGNVRLPAAVGTDDCGDPWFEQKRRAVGEALEPVEFQASETGQCLGFWGHRGAHSATVGGSNSRRAMVPPMVDASQCTGNGECGNWPRRQGDASPSRSVAQPTTLRFSDVAEDLMFIGCSTNGFYPQLGVSAALTEIGLLGFTHAEVMLYHQRQYSLEALRSYGRAAKSAEVEIVALHLEPDMHMPFDPEPAMVSDAWRNFDAAIEGAVEVGIPTIVWQGPIRVEYPVESGMEPLVEVVAELDRRCQAAGVRLAIENSEPGVLSTLRDFIEIGPQLPATVGFAFDPAHAAASQTNPMLLLRQMQGRLFDVHLRDFDTEGKRPGNLLPGGGTLPMVGDPARGTRSGIRRSAHTRGSLATKSSAQRCLGARVARSIDRDGRRGARRLRFGTTTRRAGRDSLIQ